MFKRLLSWFKNRCHKPFLSYGILSTCKRCTFAKSRETIIIVSKKGYSRNNKVLIVMNYKNHNYARRGDCLGIDKCPLECLRSIDGLKGLPCKWIRL